MSCLFSYLRPDDERAIADAIRDALPSVPVSVSHEVSPVWREYERASTTIADAFVKPIVSGYVDGVGEVIRREGVGALEPAVVERRLPAGRRARASGRRSSCSRASPAASSARATSPSAPAYASVFSLDMGGTSTDIGLVLDGEQQYASEFQVSLGHPGQHSLRRRDDDRRRRRLDRLDRQGRAAARRAAERRRRAGPRRLRPGRNRAHRRPTRISCSAVSTPTTSSAARMQLDAAAARDAFARLGERARASRPRPRRSRPSGRQTRTWRTRSA